jgi:uridine phosphorylase
MESKRIEDSELIINADGSAFHLHLKPGEVADTVLLVGDPGRVDMIASYFETTEARAENREFVSVTGRYKGKRITVVGTGIGTDNIDIVLTELDSLVNIDYATRTIKPEHTQLTFVRIGTSGSLQEDLPVDTWLLSEAAIGFDGLLNFYAGRNDVTDNDFEASFKQALDWNKQLCSPYVVDASSELIEKLKGHESINIGTTISAPGFYGPQGRVVRLGLADADINEKISAFRYNGRRITNYEMECSAIYGLSKLMGHKAATVCAIIANRKAGKYSKDYKPVVRALVEHVLESL